MPKYSTSDSDEGNKLTLAPNIWDQQAARSIAIVSRHSTKVAGDSVSDW